MSSQHITFCPRFNPLHVEAPTDTYLHDEVREWFGVSIPSMSGHLLTPDNLTIRLSAHMSFNPLHVGAPTGTGSCFYQPAEKYRFNPLHVGAPTGTDAVGNTIGCGLFQSPPCRGTY